MSDKIKGAVIGVGYLGRFHAQKYHALDEAELVAVSDLNEEQGCKVAKEMSTEYVKNYKDLLGKVDAVTVAATTSAHYEVAKFFLENGVHVHVEKPMTTTSEQGKELCELAKRNNLKLQVGHIERFNPALVAARENLKDPLFIECHRLAPFNVRGADVSVVFDLMIHDLDVILTLVKSKVKKVEATGTPVIMGTDDIVNARIEFENGAVANVTASRVSQKPQRKFRVFQQNQYLSIDFGDGKVELHTKVGDWNGEGDIPLESQTWSLEKGDALLEETRSFLSAIKNNTPCLVSGEDGLKALELVELICESAGK